MIKKEKTQAVADEIKVRKGMLKAELLLLHITVTVSYE